ncbi:succinate dehydrogenase cytochrome b subunit [Parapedobacter tibetensis]|uniref:succinate dehydrogenase cytochrome b subunit n=1 Tax=Parapedobacter tibetensis TaxID=2972951 RepID=UPI00214D6246|nr:succinate dehydrogenase cytochrome b subunit [Parapedobacter tibetensis]
MSRSKHVLSSSLGKKVIMSLTGLFLCTFLVIHLIGNLQLFYNDQGKAFNDYAYFMTHFTPIKVISYLLYTFIVIHAVWALVVTIHNKKARPKGYAVFRGSANSAWSSRNMGILGTVLLVFIVTHMSNFWWKYHNDEVPYVEYRTDLNTNETKVTELVAGEFTDYVKYVDDEVEVIKAKDLYKQVAFAFKEWYLVAFYVISMVALSFHLVHGFKSAFQSLGLDHKKYIPFIRFLGIWIFAIAIPIGFAALPVYFYFFN